MALLCLGPRVQGPGEEQPFLSGEPSGWDAACGGAAGAGKAVKLRQSPAVSLPTRARAPGSSLTWETRVSGHPREGAAPWGKRLREMSSHGLCVIRETGPQTLLRTVQFLPQVAGDGGEKTSTALAEPWAGCGEPPLVSGTPAAGAGRGGDSPLRGQPHPQGVSTRTEGCEVDPDAG